MAMLVMMYNSTGNLRSWVQQQCVEKIRNNGRRCLALLRWECESGAAHPGGAPMLLPSRKGFLRVPKPIEVQVGVCAIALHGNDLQVSPKVAGIQAADGETVPVTSKGSRGVFTLPSLVQQLQRGCGCCVQVGPDFGDACSGDTATLI